jgi:hypothetical protein
MSAKVLSAESLTPVQKSALEQILGREILSSEKVSVNTYETSNQAATDDPRLSSWKQLFGRRLEESSQFSELEIEDAVTEAMRSVRPGYSPAK